MANEDVFYLGIKILIINSKGKILLLHRNPAKANERKTWDIPGGRKQRGEDIAVTLRRELFEETGLQIGDKDVQFVGANLSTSRIQEGEIEAGLILFVYQCRWEGIPEVCLSREHSEFWWANPEEAREALQFHISPSFIPMEEVG